MSQEEAPRPSGVKLAFGALLWRLSVILFVISELGLWSRRLAHKPWIPLWRRFAFLLFRTPFLCFMAFFVAGVVTVVVDLLVRFVIRPMVKFWINPPIDTELGSFHLEAHEVIEATTPARRSVGRRWLPGTLYRTTRRLGFVPLAWDSEPWFVPLAQLKYCRSTEAPHWAWGFITGLPERILLCDRSGHTEAFIVPDPDATFALIAPEAMAQKHPLS
jgi:hypothetical protein